MLFISDKQTTDELNLLGRHQPGSVYRLFNRVKTRGGERLLENMLRHPLTNAGDINERIGVFRYFQQAGYIFPVDGETVAQFAAWVDSGANSTFAGTALSTIRKKALATLVRDEGYGQQEAGLRAAARLLQKLEVFVSAMTPSSTAYNGRIQEVREILSDKRIEKLRSPGTGFSLKEAAYYEHLLKKTLSGKMETLLSFLHEMDVYISVSSVAKEKGFIYAKAVADEANTFKVKNLKHPCLKGAVGNDLELDRQRNLLFLTGANMAGKSTLMKSVGIALYLAHAGFPVAAGAMTFSIKDGLYTSINVPDNISLGYSHFYAEVLRVKQAAELVSKGKKMLVIFDELFKGTNVKDAYDGTLAITKAFSSYSNCLFIISTHIIEVGEALSENPQIMFGYMPTEMDGNHPHYTYRLQEGITEDRQGMLIIQNEGIPEMLRS